LLLLLEWTINLSPFSLSLSLSLSWPLCLYISAFDELEISLVVPKFASKFYIIHHVYNPGVDFINIVHKKILHEGTLRSFSLFTFGFVIFWCKNIGAKILSQKSRVKCWLNWHLESTNELWNVKTYLYFVTKYLFYVKLFQNLFLTFRFRYEICSVLALSEVILDEVVLDLWHDDEVIFVFNDHHHYNNNNNKQERTKPVFIIPAFQVKFALCVHWLITLI